MIFTTRDFWETARHRVLTGIHLNIAEQTVHRHAERSPDRVALRFRGPVGSRDITYRQLSELTHRFANVLARLGVQRGERVYAVMPRTAELYAVALGTLQAGCVFCPLFSAYGPEPIASRIQIGEARVLVTTEQLYARKLSPVRERIPSVAHVLIAGEGGPLRPPATTDLATRMAAAPAIAPIQPTRPGDPALLHFTSGTTGRPKGALHVHEAVLGHHVSAEIALDLGPDDTFWCTADPGWVTGTSYGILAPLSIGATLVIDDEPFDVERWYATLQNEQVTVWYTAPTAIRLMMNAGATVAQPHDFRALRWLASVGEPLSAEAVDWSAAVFGHPCHDTWWQTETGSIAVANHRQMEVVPGSMGRPLPGIEAAILDEAGQVVTSPDVTGQLALRRGWPSMFRDYVGAPRRYAACFSGDWYHSRDLARRDAEGRFWFVGRDDDVFKTAGHLVGPFEVEAVLKRHPGVAEAAVIGVPDPVIHHRVRAYVVLKPGFEPSDDTRLTLLGYGRTQLGPAVAPREIHFVDDVPRTNSGKIMRRLLKARALGLVEGDTPTREPTRRTQHEGR